jgi:hypothetical protein
MKNHKKNSQTYFKILALVCVIVFSYYKFPYWSGYLLKTISGSDFIAALCSVLVSGTGIAIGVVAIFLIAYFSEKKNVTTIIIILIIIYIALYLYRVVALLDETFFPGIGPIWFK